jgi:hypothetical protein
MFTTITKLRNSNAEQSRVNTLEDALKKVNSAWQPDNLIPIPAVALDNVVEDVQWVLNEARVQVVIDPALSSKLMDALNKAYPSGYISAMKRSKRRTMDAVLSVYTETLGRDFLVDPVKTLDEIKGQEPTPQQTTEPPTVNSAVDLNSLMDAMSALNIHDFARVLLMVKEPSGCIISRGQCNGLEVFFEPGVVDIGVLAKEIHSNS